MISSDWIAGTIGLDWYLGLSPLKMTATQMARALKAEEYVKNRAKQWISTRKPGKITMGGLKLGDYDAVTTALQNPLHSPPDISGLTGDIQMQVLIKGMEIGFYLQENLPSTKLSGGIIAREVTPPISDQTRFMWACNAINDVRRIYDLLDAGALTVVEANAFKTLFPDLAMVTATSYLEAMINFIYSEEIPTIASWQALGLSALMGTPITDFNDVLTWQAGYSSTKGPGRPPSQAPDLANQSATDSQRKDFPR